MTATEHRKSQQTFQKRLNLEALRSGVKSGDGDPEDDAAKSVRNLSLGFPRGEAAEMVVDEVGRKEMFRITLLHQSYPRTTGCRRHNYKLHNSRCAESFNSQRNGASSRQRGATNGNQCKTFIRENPVDGVGHESLIDDADRRSSIHNSSVSLVKFQDGEGRALHIEYLGAVPNGLASSIRRSQTLLTHSTIHANGLRREDISRAIRHHWQRGSHVGRANAGV